MYTVSNKMTMMLHTITLPSHFVFKDPVYSMTEKTISGVFVSPGSAETLVRRGRITNHCLIAYSLSNISAKKTIWLICVEVVVCYISVVCLIHSVYVFVS